MKIYDAFGIQDYVIATGYKGYVIKEWFANYHLHRADLEVDLRANVTTTLASKAEPWRVTIIDTGEPTMTAGRPCGFGITSPTRSA